MNLRKGLPRTNVRGQSLFEVVLSLGVITAIIVGLVSLAAGAIRNSQYARNKTLAARYAQEATEWLRKERDENFALFAVKAGQGTWCLNNLAWPEAVRSCLPAEYVSETILSRDVIFVIDDTSVAGKTLIEATIRVFWEDGQGTHEVRSVTSFADWRQR